MGQTKDSPDEICGQLLPSWRRNNLCVAPPRHADSHINRRGVMWVTKAGKIIAEKPSRVSIARLRAMGHDRWADQALSVLVRMEAVQKAARLPRLR